jgi:dihydrofolate reductase
VSGTAADVLDQARDAAGGLDVRIGGGAATIRQFLAAGLVDHLHLAVVPVVLGSGERLLEGGPHVLDGYACTRVAASDAVAHLVFERS